MASLSELLQIELTVSDVMLLLLQTLNSMGSSLVNMPLNATEQELFETQLQRMYDRNEKALGSLAQ
jgi:octanoyl-[GcvH]:protein N-octanoyltransferase